MALITEIKNYYRRFVDLLLKHKVFMVAVIIHLIYFVLSLLLFFLGGEVDFIVYYQAGNNFINDISRLYDFPYLFPFRYLPLSAFLFVPFSLLEYHLSYVIFNLFNLMLNVLICLILYKLVTLLSKENNDKTEYRIVFLISIYLMAFPQVSTYVLGQINLYVSILLLSSLYVFLKYNTKKMQFLGSLLLGTSVIIKPISICLIPFLILIHLDLNSKKIHIDWILSFVRVLGSLIPIMLNLIIFYMFPILWADFIDTNLTSEYAIEANPSFSITKLITNFLLLFNIPFNQIFIFLGVLVVIGGISFLTLALKNPGKELIVFGYLLGMIVMLLVYFDSWDHHIVTLTPLLIIVIMIFPEDSDIVTNYLRPGFLAVSFLNLIGFAIWGATQAFFPYNFIATIFLLWILFGIVKHVIIENRNTKGVNNEPLA